MKRLFLSFSICMLFSSADAQVFYNNGAAITVTGGSTLFVAGTAVNGAGSITNSGTLNVTGNFTNNAVLASSAGNTLKFTGTAAQTVAGSNPVNAKDILINNAAGVILSTPLRADGAVTFTSGNITAASTAAPLVFTANGSVNGSPSDASHVNGYVVKEGTGSFDFPVGDALKYQKITVALTSNTAGMTAKYYAADAGAGTFTPSGTETTPLASYNTKEYWDLVPSGTAAGTVTVYWDGYKDGFENPVNQRRVAHKTGITWQNEGTTGSGSIATGSVTSNSINTWSPFTLGSIMKVLPLKWLGISGSLNTQGCAIVGWTVAETDVANYKVEKSSNGTDYQSIATISSRGGGEHTYNFTEPGRLLQPAFYRILQTDNNGHTAYSPVVKINAARADIKIYPTVFAEGFSIYTANAVTARLTDIQGKTIWTTKLNAGTTYIHAGWLAAGMYVISTDSGFRQQVFK